MKWLKLAAAQGLAIAQGSLGDFYFRGDIPRDAAEGVKWMRLAAEQNNADGRGVAQDPKEAVGLFRLAAEQGEPSAQARLGRMYGIGGGVERDLVRA